MDITPRAPVQHSRPTINNAVGNFSYSARNTPFSYIKASIWTYGNVEGLHRCTGSWSPVSRVREHSVSSNSINDPSGSRYFTHSCISVICNIKIIVFIQSDTLYDTLQVCHCGRPT